MLDFMIRSVVVGVLATAAAWLFERSLHHFGKGTRHAWTFAMLATTLLPLVPRLTSAPAPALVPQISLPALQVVDSAPSASTLNYALIVWVVSSIGAACWYLLAYLRLQIERRNWTPARVADAEVHVSDRFGPAVFGFVAPRIVVPEWVRDSDRDEQRLIVLHEKEHIAARDHLQLLLTIVLTVLLPWNIVLWFQARRLKFTLEADCDQRVLARTEDHARYANLLVEVGSRQVGLMLAPALAEYRHGLERRIAMLAKRVVMNRWKAVALMFGGILVAVVACESRTPAEKETITAPQNVKAEMPAPALSVDQRIEQAYPPLLKQAGIGGTVSLRVHVRDGGVADEVQITKSSGQEPLDLAAVSVAKGFQWGNEGPGKKTDYWTTTSITFDPQRGTMLERKKSYPASPAQMKNLQPLQKKRVSEEPTFTPYTQPPELLNRDEVSSALVRAYPPALKEAGIGGMTMLWVLLDEGGRVLRTKVKSSSGRPELDQAALEVGKILKFTPAKNGAEVVHVWIALPINFAVR